MPARGGASTTLTLPLPPPPSLPPAQAIALLDTLDKDVNTFVMRVREW